ncbi:MAG TPA: DUF1906 domain-containing protein, partial [Solirubrobacterales bacterium]|nr:DUF1906 domain-containing protein [Solirubrobacterales bacterium]
MPRNGPTGRRGSCITHAAIAAAVACATATGAAAASGGAAVQEVRYGGYEIEVPASWPVYDLAEDPSTCVRFDRHAVYLGRPSPDQRCPAHAVGRSEAVLVEPRTGAAPSDDAPSELRVEVPSVGVVVTATWRRHPGLIRRVLDGATLVSGAEPPSTAGPARQAQPSQAGATRGAYHKGLGFDACTAPSKSAMSAWSSSPYSAVGVYIGGVNRGCSQPNLTSRWVRREIRDGWALMPIYVGLQAPGTSCNCATINRSEAKSQGRAAARDAISDARALGLGPGTPIYFDMEYYTRSSKNTRAALRFLAAWTGRLHKDDYVSGVYSSASSGIRDLASRYRSDYRVPDDIWIANWDGRRTTDDPYVPDSYWSNHQRIRQYRGGHTETYRGVSINIDSNYLDGAVAGAADRDADGLPNEFDLCTRVVGPVENSGCPYPSHVSGGLVNYLNSVDGDRREGDHFTTTGAVGAAYHLERNLGFPSTDEGSDTIPLYSCSEDRDQFLTREPDCGGAREFGRIGYAYDERPEDLPTTPIYACLRTRTDERTVSRNPGCGNPDNVNQGRLGFTISVAALGRYRNSVAGARREGDHFTTTGTAGPAYQFEGNLGFLYTDERPGTIPLFSCTGHQDQFVAREVDCGGARELGRIGYAYAERPDDVRTREIYRCRRPNGERFVAANPS